MSVHDRPMSIEEIAELTGVPVRTVRYYISEGLLPGPGARGKGAAYGEEHLLRLRLIRLLGDQRVPLAEIRAQLAQLSLADVEALLREESRRLAEREQAARAPSTRQYISALLSQARSARSAPPAPPRPPASPPGAIGPLDRVAHTPAPTNQGQIPGEMWHRWELAPGVELQVRTEARRQRGRLIERLLEVARTFGHGPNV